MNYLQWHIYTRYLQWSLKYPLWAALQNTEVGTKICRNWKALNTVARWMPCHCWSPPCSGKGPIRRLLRWLDLTEFLVVILVANFLKFLVLVWENVTKEIGHFTLWTWQWDILIFNRKCIFNRSIFHCYVSFPECNDVANGGVFLGTKISEPTHQLDGEKGSASLKQMSKKNMRRNGVDFRIISQVVVSNIIYFHP